jgi:hypothetical protein
LLTRIAAAQQRAKVHSIWKEVFHCLSLGCCWLALQLNQNHLKGLVKDHQIAPILGKIDSMPFCVATCSQCSERFRLVWRIGKRKLEPSAVIHLTCPACARSFEQIAVGLVVFDSGAEQFPKSVVVEESTLE